MKHRIRINGEIKEIDCELSSGFRDRNGREIFEGDIVQYHRLGETKSYPVKFEDGEFILGRFSLNGFNESMMELADD